MKAAASIIIPTYNHGQVVGEAIRSALAQSVPVEVIVVDDGSTDDTEAALAPFGASVKILRLPHGGPSLARNAGIEAATAEWLMFLDADDLIAPGKIEVQIGSAGADIGWVLSDVRIDDAAAMKSELASERYAYAEKNLGGWVQPLLAAGNFIPIMAPLVRRSVLGAHIRFDDRLVPEDWHFWTAVAGVARLRYLPLVLATYRKSRTGRSRIPKASRAISRNIELPLRLNLGCGTPGTRSWHPIKGMCNLDKSMGWRFEDGLAEFVTGSVAAITISHSLMYVALGDWPAVFAEFARVLAPGGIVRITEDDATSPESSRRGGWRGSQPAVTLTDAAMVIEHLQRAGLRAEALDAQTTRFRDRSLIQAQHGAAPDVFFVEGIREMAVLFSPHNDDEALFASFTMLRYRPHVVVCFPGAAGYGDPVHREAESREVVGLLGCGELEQWQREENDTLTAQMRELDLRLRPTRVWAPSRRASHPGHIVVAQAADAIFGDRVTHYHTYDRAGKVREGKAVPFERPWIAHKLRALSRYESQIRHPRAYQFFLWDLEEYYEERK